MMIFNMRTGYAVATFCLALVPSSYAHFHIADTYIGEDFLDGFKWETFDDPTHGRVNFVDQQTALNTNLSYASHNKFVMRADDDKILSPSDRGRDSIRITSHKSYDDSVMVLDLSHMPEGCTTWPAFWTISEAGPWPHGGEIDIIEGVNLQTSNLASLHTTGGCDMDRIRLESGYTVSSNCDTSVNNNQGCGTQFIAPDSYGSSFNAMKGGWYVMQKTADGVNVWFWSRWDPTVPHEIKTGADNVNPGLAWGLPAAKFPVTTCDYASHFNAHQIIFDLTLCGDWAGSVYPQSGCGAGSCVDFVDNHPSAFSNAYWEVNSLRVYTPS